MGGERLSRIKVIKITIDGETRRLDKGLSDVNKRSKDLQGELRQVERLLKFNPGNTELLAQKQKLLGDQVETTPERLNRLKSAQDEVTKSFQRGEISEEQYRAFQREIVQTESTLEHFSKQLRDVEKELNNYGKSMQEAGQKMKDFGDKATSAGKEMSAKVTAPILGVGAAATMVGMEFEASMSKVAAISGATAEDVEKLSDKAKEMGATTKFSASESADAFSYMALAGWDANQMLEGISGTLALAAASGEDLASVTDIVTDGMSMFGMAAEEAGRFSDVLAATSANTNTDVRGLGEALKYAGASANAAGLDIEQTSAFIGMLANNGIKGSSAGTAMNAVLRDLGKSAKDGKIQLGDMSVSVYDAEGGMRSLSDIMGDVEQATKDMNDEARNDALRANFGDEALRGVNIALATGSDQLKELENTMYSAQGTAEKMAEVMSDNLKGRLTELKSAFEGIGITIFENLQPALESFIAWLQSLANWFSNLSPRMQNTIVIVAGLAAAIGPLLLVLGALASSVRSIITIAGKLVTSLGGAGKAVAGLRTAITLMTGPIGIAIAAVTSLVAIGVYLYQNWDEIKERLSNIWESIGEIGTNVWNGIKDFFSETWDAIKSTATTVWDSIMDFFKEWGSTIIAVITGPIGIVAKFLYDNWDSIKTFIASTVESIKNTVSDKFQDLRDAVRNWMERTYENIMSIWNRAETFLRNINLFEIGTNIIQGLINGIQDKVAELWSVVGDIAGGIKDFFANALGIASPSKVFMEFGKDIGDGLTIGLDKSLASVQAAASKMTDTLTPASSSVTGSYNSNVFNINVQGGTPRDQVDGIIRELHKRGIKV